MLIAFVFSFLLWFLLLLPSLPCTAAPAGSPSESAGPAECRICSQRPWGGVGRRAFFTHVPCLHGTVQLGLQHWDPQHQLSAAPPRDAPWPRHRAALLGRQPMPATLPLALRNLANREHGFVTRFMQHLSYEELRTG